MISMLALFIVLSPQVSSAVLSQEQKTNGMKHIAYAATCLRKNAKVCFSNSPINAHFNIHLTDSSLYADQIVCITNYSTQADIIIHYR
jgi:hypothetical protein